MSGWIVLHRKIKTNWVYDNSDYFKAWVTILMEVNYDEHKSLIKGKLLTCKRGESLLSHASWANKFGKGWNRYKVIRFFKLLESDDMIRTETAQVTTHLTVNNYAQYQDIPHKERTGKSTETAHIPHTKRTQLNKNNKNNKGTSKKDITLKDYLEQCKDSGVFAIPEDHALFEQHRKMKIPDKWIAAVWDRFVESHVDRAKPVKHRDWPKTFHNYIKHPKWHEIWWVNDENKAELTSTGRARLNNMAAATEIAA